MLQEDITVKDIGFKNDVELYLEWWNNWLTVEAMANHYGISATLLNHWIDCGRQSYNLMCETKQEI